MNGLYIVDSLAIIIGTMAMVGVTKEASPYCPTRHTVAYGLHDMIYTVITINTVLAILYSVLDQLFLVLMNRSLSCPLIMSENIIT